MKRATAVAGTFVTLAGLGTLLPLHSDGKRFSKHGHYINMSNPSYERVACGFAKSANGDIWSVQNFR